MTLKKSNNNFKIGDSRNLIFTEQMFAKLCTNIYKTHRIFYEILSRLTLSKIKHKDWYSKK